MMIRMMVVMAAFHHIDLILFFDSCQSFFIVCTGARGMSFPMGLQSRYACVAFVASVANKGFAAMVYVSMKFHVNPGI